MVYLLALGRRIRGAFLITIMALIGFATVATAAGRPLAEVGHPVAEESLAHVVSHAKSDISVEIDGVIAAIAVLEGQSVTRGDTLFTIDCRGFELALQRAHLAVTVSEATAAQAKVTLERSNEGLRNNSVSKAQNDAARLAYQTALLDLEDKKLSREIAQLAVDRCTVAAPFTGVVTGVAAGPGSYLTAGSPVMSMTETENLEVTAELTPDEIDILGNSARLTFVSGDESFPVTLRAVEPTFDPASGTQRVHLKLPPTADLPVGLNGMLRWDGGRYSLPPEYLARRGPQVGLLIEKGGTTTFLPVPGAVEGLPVLVRLPADTKVVKP